MKEGIIMMSILNQRTINHESAIEGCYFVNGRKLGSLIMVIA
jgi:hypothetical protein